MKVKIKMVAGGIPPVYKTKGAVCLDCYARGGTPESPIQIAKGERVKIPLGFCLGLPKGYEAVIRGRSGMTLEGFDVGIGTIDWDYTGEVNVVLINNSDHTMIFETGDRICQLAIRKAPPVKFKFVKELKKTERGSGGFGHTGKN